VGYTEFIRKNGEGNICLAFAFAAKQGAILLSLKYYIIYMMNYLSGLNVMFRGSKFSSPSSSAKNTSVTSNNLSPLNTSETPDSLVGKLAFPSNTANTTCSHHSSDSLALNEFSSRISCRHEPLTTNNFDVIFASGNFTKRRLGNLALTRICNEFQERYTTALKKRQKGAGGSSSLIYKSHIIRDIINKFKEEYPSSKIWTRKNDGSDDWIDITNDDQQLFSKLQWKLCRKRSRDGKGEQRPEASEHGNKRKICSVRDDLDNICDSKKFLRRTSDSIVVRSLSRVIADLQSEIDSKNNKILELEAEITALKTDSRDVPLDSTSIITPQAIGADITQGASEMNEDDPLHLNVGQYLR